MIELIALAIVAVIDAAYLVILVSSNLPCPNTKIKNLPKVSVIIAAKEGRAVRKTLEGLKKIRIPIEVIVVTSSRETAKIARKFTRKVAIDKGIGKGVALNSAVKKASGKILYFMDEDMLVNPNTIEIVCSALDGHQGAVGYNLPSNKDGVMTRVARMYITLLPKLQLGIYNLIGTTFAGGRNFAIYRKTLNGAGGFRNVLTEDLDLSMRLFVRGTKIKIVKAVGYEQVPSKFSWYMRQQQRWNVGASEVLHKWNKRFHYQDIVMFVSFLMIGLIGPLSLLFLLLAVIFNSWIFLSVTIFGFLVCLSGALYLDRDEILLSPLTFLAFIAVQTVSLFYSKFEKPAKWYRTPKVGD